MLPTPIYPPPLTRGDTVALVAPASVPERDRIERAIERLHALGLQTKTYRDFYRRRGYLAGDDAARADELMAAFVDDGVQAVFAVRGGYGATRILDRIDFEQIRKNPKVFVGFSDITALHLAIQKLTGLVTFHGPHPNDGIGIPEGWEEASATSFWHAIANSKSLLSIPDPPPLSAGEGLGPNSGSPPPSAGEGLGVGVFGPGTARGKLTGGNLATICALMGTPYEIETDDCILFLEDVGERPYRIDRCLSQLRLAGKLKNLAGVLLGWFTDCKPDDVATSLSLDDVFADYFADLGIPVLSGFAAGHDRPNLTLPFGANVEIDADRGRVLVCGE